MAASTHKGRVPGSRLDTTYTSFETEKSVRSPRTPVYVPESPPSQPVRPFDHTKFFAEATAKNDNRSTLPPPPSDKPMAWLWICHLCHSRYALGVTRRCLVDGHYYCSGESDKPSIRKKKKHKACSSEFDYAAWTVWGEWRRKALRTIHNNRVIRGCEQCDFPSQCRYAVDAHPLGDIGTATLPAETSVTETAKGVEDSVEEEDSKSKSTANDKIDFDQILKSMFSDVDTTELDNPKQKKSSSKKKRSREKSSIPSIELEVSENDKSLHDLVEMDWSNFEEIELGKRKTE